MDEAARERYAERVRALEGFGHRGSATAEEAQAAAYLHDELSALGLEPREQPFAGCSSAGARLLLPVLVAGAGALCLWGAPQLSVLLGLLAGGSLLAEGTTRSVVLSWPLLRLLPRPSRNIVARVPARDVARRRVVVLGHYDTQRTGWIWRERLQQRAARLLRRSRGPLRSPLFPVIAAIVSVVVLGLVTVIGGQLGWGARLTPLTRIGALGALTVLGVSAVMLGQWAVGPFVPGACDNASGASAAISVAEAWLAAPEPDAELVVLLTGCEETGLLGAAAWADAEGEQLRDVPTCFVNIDSIGYGRVRFLGVEHSNAAQPFSYPGPLLAVAAAVAREADLADAEPQVLPVCTDGLALLARGLSGVTVLAYDDRGLMPNYHQLTDTSDRMDFDVAVSGVRFAEQLVRRLAREGW